MSKLCMSKLCAKISSLFYAVSVVGLVACGGQTVQPEADGDMAAASSSESSAAELSKSEKGETIAPGDTTKSNTQEQEVETPVEPPVVEVMPRKQAEVTPISVEPIPAAEVPATEKAPSSSTEAPVTPSESQTADTKVATGADSGVTATQPNELASASESTDDNKPAAKVSAAAGPNEFVVTVGPKQPSHPAYGKGHTMGFIVNGVSGKELVLERGKTYTFDIRTNPKHDVYLSKKAIGWGSAPFSAGVEGAYTYKGKMTITPDENTPDLLYYACRNHPYMGGVIHIVNPGQKVDVAQQAVATKAAGGVVASKATTVSAAKVKQKLMFAEMMSESTGTKRVLASENSEAKQLVAEAKKMLEEGRKKSLVGALPEALNLANQSLKKLSEANRLVPGDEELAQMAENYKSLLAEIQGYQKSYQNNIKRMNKAGEVADDVKFDEGKFAKTLAEAKSLADQKNYVRANKLLQQAQITVTTALHKILDSKTIVYDLKFDSPADEYEYELKRFTGYEELIPVAIEAKKPAAGAIKLMESFLAKARKRRDEAQAKAEAGDYPTAISMLLQATKTVRRALRMVGVSQ